MTDIDFMKEAIAEAQLAKAKGEVPIGAVVVCGDLIVGRGHNLREYMQQSIAHAEVLAIQQACSNIGSWRLDECTIYISLEPCAMCAGTIIQSRIRRVVYGAKDPKNGAHVSKGNLFDFNFSHKVEVESGVMELESQAIIKDFFNTLRNSKDGV